MGLVESCCSDYDACNCKHSNCTFDGGFASHFSAFDNGGVYYPDGDEVNITPAPSLRPGTITVAVMRCGARMDLEDTRSWFSNPDAKTFPWDPPITTTGRRAASKAAQDLASFGFNVVVTSPLLRCVTTAVAICRQLRLPIVVDAELGEVFNKDFFGKRRVAPTTRSLTEIYAQIPRDVKQLNEGEQRLFGEAPEWGESTPDAHVRMATRVQHYTSLSAQMDGARFLLVSHSNCVAAALACAFASQLDEESCSMRIREVGYCGYVVICRRFHRNSEIIEHEIMEKGAQWTVYNGGIKLEPSDGREVKSQFQGVATGSFDPEGMSHAMRQRRQESMCDATAPSTIALLQKFMPEKVVDANAGYSQPFGGSGKNEHAYAGGDLVIPWVVDGL